MLPTEQKLPWRNDVTGSFVIGLTHTSKAHSRLLLNKVLNTLVLLLTINRVSSIHGFLLLLYCHSPDVIQLQL